MILRFDSQRVQNKSETGKWGSAVLNLRHYQLAGCRTKNHQGRHGLGGSHGATLGLAGLNEGKTGMKD
jgi:hypothetical protein